MVFWDSTIGYMVLVWAEVFSHSYLEVSNAQLSANDCVSEIDRILLDP